MSQPEYKVKPDEYMTNYGMGWNNLICWRVPPDAEGKFPLLLANRRSSEPIRTELAGKGVSSSDNSRLPRRSVR